MSTALTPRQKEVCDFLLQGMTNKQIGRLLRVSWRTIESHRQIIFQKYEVRNAIQLVRVVYNIKPERGLSNGEAEESTDLV